MGLQVDQIAKAAKCPEKNVVQSWPWILAALRIEGILSPQIEAVTAATVAVETGLFLPVEEHRAHPEKNPKIFRAQQRYWSSGYYGRGFIQLTWEDNYREYGDALGLPLLKNPNLALQPEHAARILARFFKANRIDLLAHKGEWRTVRKRVNGGLNGWNKFNAVLQELL